MTLQVGIGDEKSLCGRSLCEQLPGEVLVTPHAWGHATLNLAPSIGWASEVNFDRVYDDGLDRSHGREWWRTAASPEEAVVAASEEEESEEESEGGTEEEEGEDEVDD